MIRTEHTVGPLRVTKFDNGDGSFQELMRCLSGSWSSSVHVHGARELRMNTRDVGSRVEIRLFISLFWQFARHEHRCYLVFRMFQCLHNNCIVFNIYTLNHFG